MYKACIFDLDGTLLDTLEAISYTTNLTIASRGMEPIEKEHFKVLVGDGAGKLIERALKERGDEELKYYDEMLALYQKNFAVYSTYEVHPYEGIPELLAALKEMGLKIAVFSNKPHLRAIENVESVFGEGYFDHIQGEKTGILPKPDPTGAYEVLESLGLTKEDCLYIGDTNTDMMTGRNAGFDTVGVTWGFREEEELRSFNPAYIVHHPLEVVDILKAADK
ncbi:MAG: HAD family hydrolase [Lachnospiraceae bacterium]|nr:HAD family hydrolase [Lachnospiraceae bacterium]